MHRGRAYFKDFRDLFDGKPGKKTQLHNATLPGINFGKLLKSVVQGDDVQVLLLGRDSRVFQGDLANAGTAFGGAMTAGIVHENLPH